jgi:hypothetical protein
LIGFFKNGREGGAYFIALIRERVPHDGTVKIK